MDAELKNCPKCGHLGGLIRCPNCHNSTPGNPASPPSNRVPGTKRVRELTERQKAVLASWCGRDRLASKGAVRWMTFVTDLPASRPVVTIDPLTYRLLAEIARQDAKHGPFEGTLLGRSRLAIACLEDEVQEVREAWRKERQATTWNATREEVLQVAAVAMRALRDAL